MTEARVCIVGQAMVDVMLRGSRADLEMRLGGIVHAARMAWAIGADFDVAYIGPAYLDELVDSYLSELGAASVRKIGNVIGSPNVILVRNPEEAGPQGYESLLREGHRVELGPNELERALDGRSIADVLVFPDEHYSAGIASQLRNPDARVYVDGDLTPAGLRSWVAAARRIDCLMLSTSSRAWRESYGESFSRLREETKEVASSLLFKENRGGCRFVEGEAVLLADARIGPVAHSVGVGDAFDLAFIWFRRRVGDRGALALASALAADYASTTDVDVFRDRVTSTLTIDSDEIVSLVGVGLPWEDRPEFQAYVAAPDFEGVDRTAIDAVAEALRYHNFTPRLPVRENGELRGDAPAKERKRVLAADLTLLDACQIMVAVLEYEDPGTLIEIGLGSERGIPVVVYDPHGIADNLVLRELPTALCRSLDEVVAAVFEEAARLRRNRPAVV